MSKMLNIGSIAPDVSLLTNNGVTVDLNSFRDSKNVVLVFYPRNNTPG